MVVVGRSGAGKSTFINMFATLIAGGGYEDDRRIAITQAVELQVEGGGVTRVVLECNQEAFKKLQSEDINAGQNMAQTQKCNVYDFDTGVDGFITLIDTPGLLDPRGLKKDTEHEKNIVNSVAALGEIHAILLVHKGSDSRQDAALGYLIGEFRKLLPKECKDNIVVVFTHTANKNKIDALPALRAMGIPTDKYFAFENDCIVPPTAMRRICKKDKDYASYIKRSSSQWEENEAVFDEFTDLLSTLRPKNATLMKTLHTKKSVMFEMAYNLADKLTVNANEERIYKKHEDNLDKCISELNSAKSSASSNLMNEKYPSVLKLMNRSTPQSVVPSCTKKQATEKIEKWVDQPLPAGQKNTICLSCKKVCHDGCHLEYISVDGSKGFRSCDAFTMSNPLETDPDKCKMCRHGYESHAHRRTRQVKVVEEVPITDWKVELVDIEPAVNTAEEIKKKTEEAQKAEIEMKDQKQHAQSKLKEIVVNRESQLRMITYLFKECESLSISPINDHFEEYIEVVKKAITEDSKKSASEKANEQDSMNKLLQAYKHIKEASLKAPPELTEKEKRYLSHQFKRIEDEEENMYKEYQKKIAESKLLLQASALSFGLPKAK